MDHEAIETNGFSLRLGKAKTVDGTIRLLANFATQLGAARISATDTGDDFWFEFTGVARIQMSRDSAEATALALATLLDHTEPGTEDDGTDNDD